MQIKWCYKNSIHLQFQLTWNSSGSWVIKADYIGMYPVICGIEIGCWSISHVALIVNTLRPWQNGRHCLDDIFNFIYLDENAWISIKFSLTFVPKSPINNIPSLVQIMAWRRSGDKPLSEPMVLIFFVTHIYVARPQWVNFIYVCHRICLSTAVQVMACLLFGAKPLPKPMLTHCH